MENELPADTEQCPPKALALGLDHVDFLAAMAPKPVAILAQERDFFDVRGSLDAFHRLKQLYQLLGQEQNAALFGGQGPHGYSQENRVSCTRGSVSPLAVRTRRASPRWCSKRTGRCGARRADRSRHSKTPGPYSCTRGTNRGSWRRSAAECG